MKYFEIDDPYYALIKATDAEDATKKYIEVVAGEEEFEEIKENMILKDRSYVWNKLAFHTNKEDYPTVGDLKKAVMEETTDVLLVDGALI